MAASRIMSMNLSRPRQSITRAVLRAPPASLLQRRTKATVPFRLPDPRNEPNVSFYQFMILNIVKF
ncbi:hypothetical protein BGZ63DRAFT_373203 [Mariannaea sp. PMI_226]|nr:hypothetical protein BGZ63DRAFT_373203 [Mariannaea sp. PMI_226]